MHSPAMSKSFLIDSIIREKQKMNLCDSSIILSRESSPVPESTNRYSLSPRSSPTSPSREISSHHRTSSTPSSMCGVRGGSCTCCMPHPSTTVCGCSMCESGMTARESESIPHGYPFARSPSLGCSRHVYGGHEIKHKMFSVGPPFSGHRIQYLPSYGE